MKKILFLITLLASVSSFASDCYNSVSDEFVTLTEKYDYHSVSEKFQVHEANKSSFESYGKTVELNYDFSVISYHASNEMWGGYGVYQIIVNPMTCEILKLVEVYTE